MIEQLADPTQQAALAAAEALSPLARAQLGAILALAGVVIAPLVSLLARTIFPGRNIVFARWGFSHVFQVLLAVFAVAFGSSFVGPPVGESVEADLVRSALALGAGVVVVIITAVRFDPEGWRAIGLWRGRHAQAVVAGVASYLLLLPSLAGVALFSSWFLERIGIGFEPQLVAQRLAELPREELLASAILGVLVMPLFEEILFRGFLQPLLVQNLRERAGIAVTSLAFAALHGASAFLPIFAFSLILGAVMLRTQRLAAVYAIHALHNGLQFLVLWYSPELVHEGKPALVALLAPLCA